jgi:hypothetical protein
MDPKTIYKLQMTLMAGPVTDVTVTFADGRQASGTVHEIGANPGFVLVKHSALRHEDPLVTVDPTRLRMARVTLAGGHVEEFS